PLHGLGQDQRGGGGGRARRGGRRRERAAGRRTAGAAGDPRPREPGVKAVGARLPRYDGVAHVTGRTLFVDDVRVPGMLWTKALRSPHHSAAIRSLDTAKAEGLA